MDRKSSYSPAIANGIVYAGFIDGNFYAWNCYNGFADMELYT